MYQERHGTEKPEVMWEVTESGIEKKKRKVAAVTLETVNSSVGLNAAIVRAEMGHSATAESKKQINPSS